MDNGFVDRLAQEIRSVDGWHSLGAGALAEALAPFIEREAASALRSSGEAVGERRAPVQGYGQETIPWSVHCLAWEAYSKKYGKQQTAERLAQRGGFGVEEMDIFLPGWRGMAHAIDHPATPASPWRPIAEAPRDGTRVLLHVEGVDRPVLGQWDGSEWVTLDANDWSGRNLLSWSALPPLPTPPTSTGATHDDP